jgi:ABC-type iron transport system FetAB ATPase subunit
MSCGNLVRNVCRLLRAALTNLGLSFPGCVRVIGTLYSLLSLKLMYLGRDSSGCEPEIRRQQINERRETHTHAGS